MSDLKFVAGSETSLAAAQSIEEIRGVKRRLVWKEIYRLKEWGATDDELQVTLAMNPSTERPRRVELVESGLVIGSGGRRPTRSGRLAVVWVAKEFYRPPEE